MLIEKLTTRLSGMFYGWWMVALPAAFACSAAAFIFYGFTIILPITQEWV